MAEQQLIYKSEIERIWKAQFDSLSRKTEPELTDEEEKEKEKEAPKPAPSRTQAGMSPNVAMPGVSSRASSMERESSVLPEQSRAVLRIRRLVR